ncbi:MAG: hypothetical protein AAF674_17160 [Pseudomonadota bacterium]
MKLRALRVHNVRQFGGRGVALEGLTDGLNSFAEPNETGKSTLFDALQELLFKKHSSKDKDVAALQPYDGGNPHISADLEVDAGLFRVEKRFLAGPAFARVSDVATGREIARADAVTEWLHATLSMGNRDAGPAGLLWVRQGRSWDQSGGREARGTALASIVADQLDAMTAGERMRMAMDRAASELAPLVDARGKPKQGGAWAKAIQQVTDLEKQEANLAAQMEVLGRELTERNRLRRDLADRQDDPEETQRQAAKLAAAEQAEREAGARAARLPGLSQQLASKKQLRGNAEQDLERFVQARDAARNAETGLVQITPVLDRLQAELAAAEVHLATARDVCEAAASVQQNAARDVQQALTAETRQLAERRLTELRKARADAVAAVDATRAHRAAADLIMLDQRRLAAIEDAARALDRAQAKAEAQATTIEVAYLPATLARIRQDGAPLEGGVPLQVRTQTPLEIDGVGVLTVSPGGLDAAQEASDSVASTKASLAELLAKAEVDTAQAARTMHDRKIRLLQDAEAQEGLLATLAPDGLDAIEDEIARLELQTQETQGTDGPDLDQARTTQSAAEAALRTAETELQRARQSREEQAEKLRAAQQTQKELQTQLETVLTTTGPAKDWDAKFSALSGAVGSHQVDIERLQAELAELANAEDQLRLAQADVKRLRDALENRDLEIHQIQLRLAALDARFDNAMAEGLSEELHGTRDALAAASLGLAQITQHVRALQLLDTELKRAHRAMRETYFEPVNRELAPLLDRVMAGDKLAFDEDNFQPDRLMRDGREEDVARLSGGTQEQIAILTRLAFARLLARNGRPTPVILDDALIFTDDDRIEDMFTILNAMTADLQIIVFTCRQRAFRDLGGNLLSLTDWKPDD